MRLAPFLSPLPNKVFVFRPANSDKVCAHILIATMKQEIPYSSAQLLYYAWQLSRNRGGADDDKLTGVLSEARVDLNPHQVMAALFAFVTIYFSILPTKK